MFPRALSSLAVASNIGIAESNRLLKNQAVRPLLDFQKRLLGVFAGVRPFDLCPNALFSGVRAHFSPDLCFLNRRGEQLPHSHQIVSGGRESEDPSNFE